MMMLLLREDLFAKHWDTFEISNIWKECVFLKETLIFFYPYTLFGILKCWLKKQKQILGFEILRFYFYLQKKIDFWGAFNLKDCFRNTIKIFCKLFSNTFLKYLFSFFKKMFLMIMKILNPLKRLLWCKVLCLKTELIFSLALNTTTSASH